MANYLYNGVELPDINEVWDKTTLPYALITDRSTLEPTLVLTSLPMNKAVSGFLGSYVAVESECLYMRYILENGAWTKLDELQTGNGFSESYSDMVWSNYDIPYTDGSVYLAASEPVDPNAPTAFVYDKASFLAGLACGLCGRGVGVKEPVAYLYNGVRLPALPDYDRAVYPYVTILDAAKQLGKTGRYRVLAMSEPVGFTAVSDAWYGNYEALKVPVSVDWKQYKLNTNKDGWEFAFEDDGTNVIEWKATDFTWSGYDLKNSDGSVFMSASEPVPVYA